MILIFALILGTFSRLIGSGKHLFGGAAVNKWLTAVPYAGVLWGHPAGALIAFLFAGLAKCTGHGDGQSLKEPFRGSPEKIEILTLWAHDKLSVYWYKAFVLLALGMLRSLPAGVCYAVAVNPLHGLILALSGAGMPVAYMIGWAIPPAVLKRLPDGMNEPTNFGEFGTDFFPGLVLGWLIAG